MSGNGKDLERLFFEGGKVEAEGMDFTLPKPLPGEIERVAASPVRPSTRRYREASRTCEFFTGTGPPELQRASARALHLHFEGLDVHGAPADLADQAHAAALEARGDAESSFVDQDAAGARHAPGLEVARFFELPPEELGSLPHPADGEESVAGFRDQPVGDLQGPSGRAAGEDHDLEPDERSQGKKRRWGRQELDPPSSDGAGRERLPPRLRGAISSAFPLRVKHTIPLCGKLAVARS